MNIRLSLKGRKLMNKRKNLLFYLSKATFSEEHMPGTLLLKLLEIGKES